MKTFFDDYVITPFMFALFWSATLLLAWHAKLKYGGTIAGYLNEDDHD